MKTLSLVVLNNREKKIFNEKIENGTRPELNIEPGLYYWQLQDSEETLLTGRLVISRLVSDKCKPPHKRGNEVSGLLIISIFVFLNALL